MENTKIMIVEDEITVAQNLEVSLKSHGYEIVGMPSTGEEAIKLAGTKKPNLILMDIMLAGNIDGVNAAKQIYEQFKIPVIYLTAYSDENTLRRARHSGAYGFVLKPFDLKELNAAIEIALFKDKPE